MGDDRVAITDRLAVVHDVRQLPARRRGCIENVLVLEWHPVKPQEREYLQAIAVVVGNAEQFGIGIERDHRVLHGTDGGDIREESNQAAASPGNHTPNSCRREIGTLAMFHMANQNRYGSNRAKISAFALPCYGG